MVCIIKPHSKYAEPPTSGNHLLEHANAEIIYGLSDKIKYVVLVEKLFQWSKPR